MKLKFSHLYLENFMSFSLADVDLSVPGFALVVGENLNPDDGASSNGSGKSTIFEAIYWCLTGNTIRGSKDVVNKNFEKDGCYVELQFYADNKFVELLRSKNHKKHKTNLFIRVDGNDISAKGIRDSEKVFATTFPELSSDLIGSVIILGQGLPNRFTANTPSGRKQILEQLTNSDFMIESLKLRLNSREVEINTDIRNAQLSQSNINGQITAHQNLITSLNNQRQNSQKDILKEMIDDRADQKNELMPQLEEESRQLSKLKDACDIAYKLVVDKQGENSSLVNYRQIELNEVVNKFTPKLSSIDAEIKSLEAYVHKAESIKDVCPTCGQKLVGVEKIDCSAEKEKIEKLYQEYEAVDAEKCDAYNKIGNAYVDRLEQCAYALDFAKKDYERLKNEKTKQQNRVDSLTYDIQKLDKEINSLQIQLAKEDIDYDAEIKKQQDIIDQLNEKLLYTNNELEDLAKHSAVITKFQTFVKRDFRGYLLDQYITFLNKTAKRYCSSLFGSDKILISLDGNNLSISYSNKEYESLSGGEKQKVDLLVQFSIREMLRSTLNFSSNILVLDEITDNLDEEGCQKLINFISSSFKDLEGIYLISHRKDLDIPYDYMIHVVKETDGTSRIS